MRKFSVFVFAFIMIFASALLSIGFLPSLALAESDENAIEINSQNFVEVLNAQENYSKTLTLVEDIDISSLIGWNEVSSKSFKFTGVFDGNGHTLSNLKISSKTNNYGLFSNAENAVIKNLKIDGKIGFNLSNSSLSYNIGTLVGNGYNIKIENCYIASDVIFTTNLDSDIMEVNGGANIGGLVGRGEGLTVSNCVANQGVKISSSTNFASINYVGGLVGSQSAGKIEKSVSYANIEILNIKGDENFYLGGITGEISGRSATIRDCVFLGNLKGDMANKGGIVGINSLTNSVARGNVEFAYWSDKIIEKAIAVENGYTNIESEKLKNVEYMDSDFFDNSENWYPLSNGWDFSLTYFMRESQPHLQMFESFNFSISPIFSNVLENVTFENATTENANATVKFGEEVKITLKLKSEIAGYYEISYLRLNNALTTRWTSEEILNEQGKLSGYIITIISSDLTDGIYSFEFKSTEFRCEATVSDTSQGGVREKSGQTTTDKLQQPLFYDSSPITIVAEGKGIYNFSHWELYYLNEDDEWELSPDQTQFDFNSSNLEIKFGIAPFDRDFQIKAYFSDQNAISVKFNNTGATAGINSIHFSGVEYVGEAIRVSSTARTCALKVVLNKGYRLDTKAFENFIKGYYGSASTASIIRNIDEGEEFITYEMSINMAIINENINDKEFTLSLFVKEFGGAETQNLLWLYITIPVVIVVAVGAVLLIIFLRKKGVTKRMKNKKEEDEEIDYKDFYI